METTNPLEKRVNPRLTIWLPLWIAIILVVATIIVFLIAYFTDGEISKWASAFSTLAITTIIVTSLMMFVFLAFGIGGMKEVSKYLPDWMLKLQIYSTIGNVSGRRISNGITRPIILIKQSYAGFRSAFVRK
jgi:hypothetical protein